MMASGQGPARESIARMRVHFGDLLSITSLLDARHDQTPASALLITYTRRAAPEIHGAPPRATSRVGDSRRRGGEMKRAVVMLFWVFWLFCAAPASADWCAGIDRHPLQVKPHVWHFTVRMPCAPLGEVYFVNSQYNFLRYTRGIKVDYAFDGPGIDFRDGRGFYAIAPTLFNTLDGYLNGWAIVDLNDVTFEGLVHATTALDSVEFQIEADGFVGIR
jgi:hypothetical protein